MKYFTASVILGQGNNNCMWDESKKKHVLFGSSAINRAPGLPETKLFQVALAGTFIKASGLSKTNFKKTYS